MNLDNKLQIIRRVCRKFRRLYERANRYPTDLGGACDSASKDIQRELRFKYNIRAKLVGNSGHAFLLYKNYIIDVTATQFGINTKVVVRHRKRCKNVSWWHIDKHSSWFLYDL